MNRDFVVPTTATFATMGLRHGWAADDTQSCLLGRCVDVVCIENTRIVMLVNCQYKMSHFVFTSKLCNSAEQRSTGLSPEQGNDRRHSEYSPLDG